MVKIKFQKLHLCLQMGHSADHNQKEERIAFRQWLKLRRMGRFCLEMTLWSCWSVLRWRTPQAAIADHFKKMFLRDMPDQTFDEVHNRDRFTYIFIMRVDCNEK